MTSEGRVEVLEARVRAVMVCLPLARREAVMKLPTLPPAWVAGQIEGK
jgi:hypothetical protein